jgi:hypothetical protein
LKKHKQHNSNYNWCPISHFCLFFLLIKKKVDLFMTQMEKKWWLSVKVEALWKWVSEGGNKEPPKEVFIGKWCFEIWNNLEAQEKVFAGNGAWLCFVECGVWFLCGRY